MSSYNVKRKSASEDMSETNKTSVGENSFKPEHAVVENIGSIREGDFRCPKCSHYEDLLKGKKKLKLCDDKAVNSKSTSADEEMKMPPKMKAKWRRQWEEELNASAELGNIEVGNKKGATVNKISIEQVPLLSEIYSTEEEPLNKNTPSDKDATTMQQTEEDKGRTRRREKLPIRRAKKVACNNTPKVHTETLGLAVPLQTTEETLGSSGQASLKNLFELETDLRNKLASLNNAFMKDANAESSPPMLCNVETSSSSNLSAHLQMDLPSPSTSELKNIETETSRKMVDYLLYGSTSKPKSIGIDTPRKFTPRLLINQNVERFTHSSNSEFRPYVRRTSSRGFQPFASANTKISANLNTVTPSLRAPNLNEGPNRLAQNLNPMTVQTTHVLQLSLSATTVSPPPVDIGAEAGPRLLLGGHLLLPKIVTMKNIAGGHNTDNTK